jgi:hypothetical protein
MNSQLGGCIGLVIHLHISSQEVFKKILMKFDGSGVYNKAVT